MESDDEDSLFLLDEEVPAADSVAEDVKSRPIETSFSQRNERRSWRNHDRGGGASMYGKSCPAAPIVGSMPTPSHFADAIPDLSLPPNSHQEISYMLSRANQSTSNSSGSDGEDSDLNDGQPRRPTARFLHFEEKRAKRRTRNVFGDMASSCPAQLPSNFMGGRGQTSSQSGISFRHDHKSGNRGTRSGRPPRAPGSRRKTPPQNTDRKRAGDAPGPQQGSEGADEGVLSTSQTALSILQNYSKFKEEQRQSNE